MLFSNVALADDNILACPAIADVIRGNIDTNIWEVRTKSSNGTTYTFKVIFKGILKDETDIELKDTVLSDETYNCEYYYSEHEGPTLSAKIPKNSKYNNIFKDQGTCSIGFFDQKCDVILG